MLSDPISVTYDGSPETIPVSSGQVSRVARLVGSRYYAQADREFEVITSSYLLGNGALRSEILLGRRELDVDGPFTGSYHDLPNHFGLVYQANNLRFNTSTDIPLLRTALLAFVDSTLEGRLVAGEL